MRSIGTAQRALDMMLTRVSDPARKTFGKYLREHGTFDSSSVWIRQFSLSYTSVGTILSEIAKSRAEIDQARLLVLTAAHQIDAVRAKGAMKDIGVAKVSLPWPSPRGRRAHPCVCPVYRAHDGLASRRSCHAGFRRRRYQPRPAPGSDVRRTAYLAIRRRKSPSPAYMSRFFVADFTSLARARTRCTCNRSESKS